MTNNHWELPARRLSEQVPASGENVSPQLLRALRGWLQQVLVGVSPDRTVRPSADYGSEVRQIMLRFGADVPPWEFPPDIILDAVDLADSTGRRNTLIMEVCDGREHEAGAGFRRGAEAVGGGPGVAAADAVARSA